MVMQACQSITLEEELQGIRQRAVDYLLNQQAVDGGWHSNVHGILKGGQAYTPFILDILSTTGATVPDSASKAATSFILSKIDNAGVLGVSGKYVAEYPVYATAMAVKNWYRQDGVYDTLHTIPSYNYLLEQQYTAIRGIDLTHPAYGSWGFGEENLPRGEVGHVDLSHTRRVLEALTQVPDVEDKVWANAQIFLNRLQNEDGGFCSSTYTLGANKADSTKDTCVSYATATADGVLALLALPHPSDIAIRTAKTWLLANERWDRPSGILTNHAGDWDKVLYYYHLSVRAQAYAALSIEGNWRRAMLRELGGKQTDDGSFRNPWGAPNKEDDPLLATALVIKAIDAALH